MRTLWLALVLCFAVVVSFSASAFAVDKKAKQMVSKMAESRDALLQKHPSVVLIDNAIRADCSAKGENALPRGEFCSCASAVTFGLWLSGMDPKMINRLNGFLQQPSERAASQFIAYQGPEMYAPLCSKAI